jgi:hypothetical protein
MIVSKKIYGVGKVILQIDWKKTHKFSRKWKRTGNSIFK